jgi:hypothetical protein
MVSSRVVVSLLAVNLVTLAYIWSSNIRPTAAAAERSARSIEVVTKTQRIVADVPTSSGLGYPETTVTATCGPDQSVTGGGYKFRDFQPGSVSSNSFTITRLVRGSFPNSPSNPIGWTLDLQDPLIYINGPQSSYTVEVYALCASDVALSVSGASANAVKTGKDDDSEQRSALIRTEEQRQNRQLTNRSNRDDLFIEGNVLEVGTDTDGSFIVIANRDGKVKVRLNCKNGCPTVRVGNYVEANGVKQNEQLFDAEDVSVRR